MVQIAGLHTMYSPDPTGKTLGRSTLFQLPSPIDVSAHESIRQFSRSLSSARTEINRDGLLPPELTSAVLRQAASLADLPRIHDEMAESFACARNTPYITAWICINDACDPLLICT